MTVGELVFLWVLCACLFLVGYAMRVTVDDALFATYCCIVVLLAFVVFS